ncbi:hypothetical protein ACJBU6_02718 [Exserohilum turcicum]
MSTKPKSQLPYASLRNERPASPTLDPPPEEGASLEFTQRIEKKLFEYNASKNVFKRWLFEMVSWLISASCMIAIILIYLQIKDRPISESSMFLIWTNVLGKVSSATLIMPVTEALGQLKWNWFQKSNAMWDFDIFDKACKGPLGAVMLLFRTKGRSLAALGALLILLLLAIDSFFQQVVDLPDIWALQDTASALPKMTRYTANVDTIWREGAMVANTNGDMALVIDKFSYGNGTQPVKFGNGTRPDIPVSCPSSNCTWPVYDTLGVCSECADISSYLTFDCLTQRVDWTSELRGGFNNEGAYPNATMCGYFLNATGENPILMSGYIYDPETAIKGEALLTRILPLTTLFTRELLFGEGSIHFKNHRHTIADVLVVSASNGSAKKVLEDAPPIANECVLYWCVQTLISSYNYGLYHEEVIETTFNATAGTSPWLAIPYKTEFENGTDIFHTEDVNISTNYTEKEDSNSIYGVSNDTAAAIIQAFVDIFPSFTTVANETSLPVLRFKTWSGGPAWTRNLAFNPWLSSNISSHMQRLARAMTNVMRSVSTHQDVEGLAFSKEIFVSVRWEWLAFPLVLLVLSLVFLVSTMRKTSKDTETAIWKTSTMPTLIYSLPKEVQGQLSEPSGWNSTNKTKKLRIRLHPKSGWRVSGQSQLNTSPRLPPPAIQAPRGWI